MAVAFDRVYPRQVDASEADSLLTPAQIASAVITAVEAGKGWKRATLEALSAATGANVRGPVTLVRRVVHEIREDLAAMRAVNPLDYTLVTDYVAALNAASQYVPVSTWAQHLQEAYGITEGTNQQKFDELKAILLAQQGTP
jgi:hypothetical protein